MFKDPFSGLVLEKVGKSWDDLGWIQSFYDAFSNITRDIHKWDARTGRQTSRRRPTCCRWCHRYSPPGRTVSRSQSSTARMRGSQRSPRSSHRSHLTRRRASTCGGKLLSRILNFFQVWNITFNWYFYSEKIPTYSENSYVEIRTSSILLSCIFSICFLY